MHIYKYIPILVHVAGVLMLLAVISCGVLLGLVVQLLVGDLDKPLLATHASYPWCLLQLSSRVGRKTFFNILCFLLP